jgi:hypothetical protein
MSPSETFGRVQIHWHTPGWFPESTPIYDAIVAATCEHGWVASAGCWRCCMACDMAMHRCVFCGDDLRHDLSSWDQEPGAKHPCYAPLEPVALAEPFTYYPIYRSVARDMPEAAQALNTWRIQMRRIAIEVNELNARAQEKFRALADLRMKYAVKPGESLLMGITKT